MIIKLLEDFKINVEAALAVAVIAVFIVLGIYVPALAWAALDVILLFSPIWVPLLLGVFFWNTWMEYIRSKYLANEKHTLLEIRFPREITKSPKAMEAVLDGLHIKPGESTFIDKYIKGKVRPWFSLEIVSLGGDVRFFIWTRAFFRSQIENQIYAQYPTVEIQEVEDYTDQVTPDLDKYSLWGCNFKLTNGKEPALPIKTYTDYELDKDPKEEFKIDPLSNMVEVLGSLKRGEYMWLQILIQVSRADWKKQAQQQVQDIRKEATPETEDGPGMADPTDEQKNKIKAITRKMSKAGFDCGMRGIYLAEKDRFDPSRIAALTSIVKQFSSQELNGLRPFGYLAEFDFPWQDFQERRQNRTRKEIFDAYKRRSYFYPPHTTQPFVLNTEELATLFHFPSSVTQPPTLSRIPSKRAAPPTDLPTEE